MTGLIRGASGTGVGAGALIGGAGGVSGVGAGAVVEAAGIKGGFGSLTTGFGGAMTAGTAIGVGSFATAGSVAGLGSAGFDSTALLSAPINRSRKGMLISAMAGLPPFVRTYKPSSVVSISATILLKLSRVSVSGTIRSIGTLIPPM
jgi:hypothetical protein